MSLYHFKQRAYLSNDQLSWIFYIYPIISGIRYFAYFYIEDNRIVMQATWLPRVWFFWNTW